MDKNDLLKSRNELIKHHRKMISHIRNNLYSCSMESKIHGEIVNNSSFGYEPKPLDAKLIEDIVGYVEDIVDQLEVCLNSSISD